MAEKYFPFNAADPADPDRYYNADDVSTFDGALFSSGVVAFGNQLEVTAGTGMQTQLDTGFAIIQGKRYENTTIISFTHDPADGINPRIDRIVIRRSTTNRSVQAFLLKGTAAISPTAPALTRTSDVYEIAVADVLVSAGVTSITADKITDKRADATVCGMVTANIVIDLTATNAQITALIDHLVDLIDAAEGGTIYEIKALRFSDTVVETTDFVADATYDTYGFRAAVPLTGVLSSMDADVRFDVPEATSGAYAPVATSYNGGVYIYATAVPDADITIPRIICA